LITKLSYICFPTSKINMKNKQLTLLVVLTILFVTVTNAQPQNFVIKNGFSIGGGLTQFNIKTENFTTIKGSGFTVGFATTAGIPHKWYNVSYGMQILENTFEILGSLDEAVDGNEMIKYKLMAAQLGFLFHSKIIESNLTFDAGPQLQYNGNLEFKSQEQEIYYINGFNNLSASDITDLSKFNINGAVGFTAGIGFLKVRAQYIYGFLNILSKLNTTTENSFKGNPETLVFTAMFTF
jgi:hypothetical protein